MKVKIKMEVENTDCAKSVLTCDFTGCHLNSLIPATYSLNFSFQMVILYLLVWLTLRMRGIMISKVLPQYLAHSKTSGKKNKSVNL
jgi:hypothetical protein